MCCWYWPPIAAQAADGQGGNRIDALRKAGADRSVHARVPGIFDAGRTEADVAADIAEAIVAEGHSEVALMCVGSGPHEAPTRITIFGPRIAGG